MNEAGGAAPADDRLDWRGLCLSPLVLIAFACTIGAVALVFLLNREAEKSAFAGSVKVLDTLTFALAEHAAGTFSSADTALKVARDTYMRDRDRLPDLYESNNRALDRALFPLEAVIRADGRMYLSSTRPRDLAGAERVDLSDRAHFAWHRDGNRDDMFVSEPITGRVSGKQVLNLSRRIDGADGHFAGVAVVSVSPEAFLSPYRHIVGTSGVIALYGRDGIARVRLAGGNSASTANISKARTFQRMLVEPFGNFVALSEVDGKERLYSYRALNGLPLFMVVGYGIDELIERRDSGILRYTPATYGLIVIALGALTLLALWSQVLRQRLENSNRALTRAASDASRDNQAKTRFLASVSHELRTPLHGVTGYAQLLAMDAPDVATRETAETIFRSARHMRDVVDGLLDMAKAEAGLEAVDFHVIDVSALVNEVVDAHLQRARAKNLTLAATVAAGIPQGFSIAPLALKRVLHNLVDNAIKFTAVGRVEVRVQTTADGRLEFSVTDTGVGIPDDAVANLFEPYRRSTGSTDGAIAGTGLGLAISAGLVQAMGGTLTVKPRSPQGTEFGFVLASAPLGSTRAARRRK